MRDFRTLKVWEKAHQLTLAVYANTNRIPIEERFGITSQLRRTAFYIPASIAEGCGGESDESMLKYFQTAMRNATELEYLLLLAKDLGYLADVSLLNEQTIEVKKMLSGFINKVRIQN